MCKEGNLLLFGNTLELWHSLILIVGREANNRGEIIPELGTYAEQGVDASWPSVPFWSNTYGLIGSYGQMTSADLKAECSTNKSSPIVICDASPKPLDGSYSTPEKKKIRKNIPQENIDHHIQRVFEHKQVVKRIKLVIFSGIRGSGLDHSIKPLELACEENSIPSCHIHGISSRRHSHQMRRNQLGEYANILESVMAEFLSQNVRKAA